MTVPFEPVFGGVFLVCTKVIDRVFEDIWPGCMGGVVNDLFHPCHEGGAVVLVIGGAEGSEDGEGGKKSLYIGERRQKFGFSCEDFLVAGVEVWDDAIDRVIAMFPMCFFVSEEFGEIVDFECAMEDSREVCWVHPRPITQNIIGGNRSTV